MDVEIEEYVEKAYGRDTGKEESTIKMYANRLKFVKEHSGCSSFADFSVKNKDKSAKYWDRLIAYLKNKKYSKSTVNVTIASLISYCRIMGIDLPSFVRHQKKVTGAMAAKSGERKRLKEKLRKVVR